MKSCMLINLQRMDDFNNTDFVKNQNYECGGLLKVKIHVLFCGEFTKCSTETDEIWCIK
jgi:hypothetical protein